MWIAQPRWILVAGGAGALLLLAALEVPRGATRPHARAPSGTTVAVEACGSVPSAVVPGDQASGAPLAYAWHPGTEDLRAISIEQEVATSSKGTQRLAFLRLRGVHVRRVERLEGRVAVIAFSLRDATVEWEPEGLGDPRDLARALGRGGLLRVDPRGVVLGLDFPHDLTMAERNALAMLVGLTTWVLPADEARVWHAAEEDPLGVASVRYERRDDDDGRSVRLTRKSVGRVATDGAGPDAFGAGERSGSGSALFDRVSGELVRFERSESVVLDPGAGGPTASVQVRSEPLTAGGGDGAETRGGPPSPCASSECPESMDALIDRIEATAIDAQGGAWYIGAVSERLMQAPQEEARVLAGLDRRSARTAAILIAALGDACRWEALGAVVRDRGLLEDLRGVAILSIVSAPRPDVAAIEEVRRVAAEARGVAACAALEGLGIATDGLVGAGREDLARAIVADLRGFLASADTDVRRAALLGLGNTGREEAWLPVAAHLADASEDVRAAAALALRAANSCELREKLARCAREDPSARVREAAQASLEPQE